MSYLLPFDRSIKRSQDFGANPGWGPNPPGGHNGDDWATPEGTPVRAAGDGVVVFAGSFDDTYADNWGWNLHYGGLMVILNMDGPTAPYFEYGHNSRLLVKAGERVVRGQVIALTGNTDGGTRVSTGPHCHVGCLPYNFNLGTSTYGRVNPRLYMTEWPDSAGSMSYAASSESIKLIQEDDMPSVNDLLYAPIPKYDIHGKEVGTTTLAESVAWQEANFYHGRKLTIDAIRETVLGVLTAAVPDVATGGTTNLATEVSWLPANFKRDGGAVDVEKLAESIANAVVNLSADKPEEVK